MDSNTHPFRPGPGAFAPLFYGAYRHLRARGRAGHWAPVAPPNPGRGDTGERRALLSCGRTQPPLSPTEAGKPLGARLRLSERLRRI